MALLLILLLFSAVVENLTGTLESFALFEGNLLIDVVFPGLAFFFLHKQVIRTRHLIVLVVLHKSDSLVQVLPAEILLEAVQLFRYDGNTIAPHNDSVHLDGH